MTDREGRDEALRRAFQSLADTTGEEPSAADNDQVWRALSEELPAAERRALVDRMGRDPALAESWRAAHELSRDVDRPLPSTAGRTRGWAPPLWMTTAAAVLLVGIGIAVTVQLSRPAVDEFRDVAPYVVNSLVASDTILSRDEFRLRWTPGPEGSRYHLRVTTEDLEVLTDVSDLTAPEYMVSREVLSSLSSGSRLFWQVDVVPPEGSTVSSQTFVVKVQ